MRRVLFHFFGMPVRSYPAMLYLGTVLGIYAQLYAAASIGLPTGPVLAAALLLFTAALLGARLLHVLAFWRFYRRHPGDALRFSRGGAAMYGGLLLAVPLSLPLLAVLAVPFSSFWDTASFTLLIGMIVTRIGCLLNGCCAGRPTSGRWGVNLPDHKGVWRRRVPAQILEILWGSLVLGGAVWLWGRLPFPGALFFYTVGAYGAGRMALETVREEQDRVLGVRLHRAISGGFVAASLWVFGIAWLG